MNLQDISDALDLVKQASIDCANGPIQPWRFIQRVRSHLEERQDELCQNEWNYIRSEQ